MSLVRGPVYVLQTLCELRLKSERDSKPYFLAPIHHHDSAKTAIKAATATA